VKDIRRVLGGQRWVTSSETVSATVVSLLFRQCRGRTHGGDVSSAGRPTRRFGGSAGGDSPTAVVCTWTNSWTPCDHWINNGESWRSSEMAWSGDGLPVSTAARIWHFAGSRPGNATASPLPCWLVMWTSSSDGISGGGGGGGGRLASRQL